MMLLNMHCKFGAQIARNFNTSSVRLPLLLTGSSGFSLEGKNPFFHDPTTEQCDDGTIPAKPENIATTANSA